LADELPEKIQDVKWDDLEIPDLLRALSERASQVKGIYIGVDIEGSYLVIGRDLSGDSAEAFLDEMLEIILSGAKDFGQVSGLALKIVDMLKEHSSNRMLEIGGVS